MTHSKLDQMVEKKARETWGQYDVDTRNLDLVKARNELVLEYDRKHPDAIAALLTGEGAVVPVELTGNMRHASEDALDMETDMRNWYENTDIAGIIYRAAIKAGRLDGGE